MWYMKVQWVVVGVSEPTQDKSRGAREYCLLTNSARRERDQDDICVLLTSIFNFQAATRT
jgi:hypothetical protein